MMALKAVMMANLHFPQATDALGHLQHPILLHVPNKRVSGPAVQEQRGKPGFICDLEPVVLWAG
jgi:hypothetical protein